VGSRRCPNFGQEALSNSPSVALLQPAFHHRRPCRTAHVFLPSAHLAGSRDKDLTGLRGLEKVFGLRNCLATGNVKLSGLK
jgi:hypothetical protein